jgi:hypothetical protein
LYKQKRLLKEYKTEMTCRGLKYLDELVIIKKKEKKERKEETKQEA